MIKRYGITAIVYTGLALVFGVFYREFTKGMAFVGQTNLSVMHTHYLLLGTVFFLLMMILEKVFAFSSKTTGKLEIVYHVGLNVTGIAFLVRGILQIVAPDLSKGASAAVSGVAGIGHALLGATLIWLLVLIVKAAIKSTQSPTENDARQ